MKLGNIWGQLDDAVERIAALEAAQAVPASNRFVAPSDASPVQKLVACRKRLAELQARPAPTATAARVKDSRRAAVRQREVAATAAALAKADAVRHYNALRTDAERAEFRAKHWAVLGLKRPANG
jgi:hypothetical protein